MNRALRAVFRLYPRWWWRRYGAELEALVEETDRSWSTIFDLALGALDVRLRQRAPRERSSPLLDLLGRPSAFSPVVMSLVALTAAMSHALFVGTAPQPDEGTAAHVWQLMMAGQLPFVARFAVRWLPVHGRPAAGVMAIQLCSALAAMFPVWWFKW